MQGPNDRILIPQITTSDFMELSCRSTDHTHLVRSVCSGEVALHATARVARQGAMTDVIPTSSSLYITGSSPIPGQRWQQRIRLRSPGLNQHFTTPRADDSHAAPVSQFTHNDSDSSWMLALWFVLHRPNHMLHLPAGLVNLNI